MLGKHILGYVTTIQNTEPIINLKVVPQISPDIKNQRKIIGVKEINLLAFGIFNE